MKLTGKIKDNKFLAELKKACEWEYPDAEVEITIRKKNSQRTLHQNASLHLLFQQISDQCLEHGIEMRQLVREEIPIQVTPENVKWMWKLLQDGLFGKRKTSELKKSGEIGIVYDNFKQIIGERTNWIVDIPEFPSIDLLIDED